MVDISPQGRPMHINAATIGAVAATIGLIGTLVGFVGGYQIATASINQFRDWHVEDQVQFKDLVEKFSVLQRQTDRIEGNVTNAAKDAASAKQGTDDIKRLTAGTNR